MSANFKIWDTYISPATNSGMDIGSDSLRFSAMYMSGDADIGGIVSTAGVVTSSFRMSATAAAGRVLTCDAAGIGTWQVAGVQFMIYPPTAGLVVSTGSAWGTSVTDYSSHWNSAYGWGNHANIGYLTAVTANSPLSGTGTAASHLVFNNPGYIDGVVADAPLYGSGTLASHLTVNVSNLQPKDATLTAIAALDTTPGYLYQTGADTFIKSVGSTTSDTLNTVTTRGNSTSNGIVIGGSGVFNNISTEAISASGNITALSTSSFGAQGTDKTVVDPSGHQVMYGTARPWRDEAGNAVTLKISGPGVSINSSESTLEFTTSSNLSDFAHTNVQLNHDRDLTSIISPHIHWFQGENNVPNFLLQYRWQVLGGVKDASWVDLKCNTKVFTYNSGTIHQLCESNDIVVPGGTNISDIVQFKILRDNNNSSGKFAGADPYTTTVGILSFDIHIMINSLGSTQEYVK